MIRDSRGRLPTAGRFGLLVLPMLVVMLSVSPSASAYELTADHWARPRSAAAVLGMDAVRQAVAEWVKRPGGIIEIQYPGGEAGMLWADELRDWLVSLGVPLDGIRTLSGSAAADRLQLVIRQPETGQ